MIALCSSLVRRLLPNVDGIIGFRPPRHLHWVVYQPKGSLWGHTVGEKKPFTSYSWSYYFRQWEFKTQQRRKMSQKSAVHQGFEQHVDFERTGSFFIVINRCTLWNETQLDHRKEEVSCLFLARAPTGWWHQLRSIIVMLSSIGHRDWMRHKEVIQGNRDTKAQRFLTPSARKICSNRVGKSVKMIWQLALTKHHINTE